MDKYEELSQEAAVNGITIDASYNFRNERLKGLYCDGTVALNKDLKNNTERACVLAEELGHHYTTTGNIIDLQDVRNVKQERKARIWAYDKMIGLFGLIRAFEHACRNRYEIAEYLGVTEEFLQDAINYYQARYGEFTTIDHYVIRFMPYLAVAKLY